MSVQPVNLGDVQLLLLETVTGASTKSQCVSMQASGGLISLFVQEITGTLDVNVYTLTRKGEEKLIDSFPQISAPTTELLLRKQVEVHDQLRVEVITSDSAKYDIRVKGVEAGVASVQIQGADTWGVLNETATTTPAVLVPAGLEDRNGLLIRNANFTTSEVLRIAETEAKLLSGVYASILPGESIQPDIRAGAEIWAEASSGSIRVEIVEIG